MNTYDRKLAARKKADELLAFLRGEGLSLCEQWRPTLTTYFLAQSRPRNADRPADKRRARRILKRGKK